MKAFDSTVTVERVKGLLSYNPDTGIFTWRVDRNPWHLKGMVDNNSYIEHFVNSAPGEARLPGNPNRETMHVL